MRFGAHVRQSGGLLAALERGERRGCEVIQLFTQSPRQWRPTAHDPEQLREFRRRREASGTVGEVVCHGTYLLNLATADEALRERSRACLEGNLRVAAAIGASAVVVHVGSHRGAGLVQSLPAIADALARALDAVPGCDVLLENTAGAGGTVGRALPELAAVIGALGGDERVGVCLDSQHLWASGVSFGTPEQMDAVIAEVDREVGLERLRCLHVNDSKVPFGSNRDRHANLGEGTMGDGPLRCFLGHPALRGLPAVLEIEGVGGEGADRADLQHARRLHEEGAVLYG